MKTFVARPQAIVAVASVVAAVTFPALAGGTTYTLAAWAALCVLSAAIAVHDLASLLIPDRYTAGILVIALAGWWFEAGDFAALVWRIGSEGRGDAPAVSTLRPRRCAAATASATSS